MTFDEIGQAFHTIGDSVPVRREGEVIPDAPNGCFSIQWFHGPRLFYRQGDKIIEFRCQVIGL